MVVQEIEVAVRGRFPLTVRTGWVVVRKTRRENEGFYSFCDTFNLPVEVGTRLQRHSLEDDEEDRREYRYQADDSEGHRIRGLARFNAADTVLLLRLEVPRAMTAQYQRAHRKR